MSALPLANAPVSFGVWGPHAGLPGVSAGQVLNAVLTAGYAGSELGPADFHGSAEQTATAYLEAGLQCAGVYVGLHLQDPGGLPVAARRDLAELCERLVAVRQRSLEAAGPAAALPLGPIVLADEGSSVLRDHPARDPGDRSLALDDDAWRSAAGTVADAQRVIEDHGLRASFHPHLATYVESRWEVERLLETTAVGITLDTGHLLLAGADPVRCLRDWGERVDHVHLKDVRADVPAQARSQGRECIDHWWGAACVPFGHGDVDLRGTVAAVVAMRYRGWLVVEQDRAPTPEDDLAAVTAEQRANRDWLVATLAELG